MDAKNFAKGMGLGLVVGSAITMAMTPNKMTKKGAVGKALKNVGEIVESIGNTFGM